MIDIEIMSPVFTKHHLRGLPFAAVLHHFTAPDEGDPHDHPWGFTTHVLRGGYVEDVYSIHDETWTVDRYHRRPGTAHHVAADTIHRIWALPEGECWTIVFPEPAERETRFWRFTPNAAPISRHWSEPEMQS